MKTYKAITALRQEIAKGMRDAALQFGQKT